MSDVVVHSVAKNPQVNFIAQSQGRGTSWKPVALADYMAGSYQKPEPTVGSVANSDVGLFYPGRLNSVFGESGSGKTFFMLHVMKEEMEKGNDVLYIDYEDAPETAIHRLRQLGADDETIEDHLIYIRPNEKWTPRIETELGTTLAGRNVTLTVLDSVGESIATDGYNPNADEEVARWFNGSPRFLKSLGVAVVLLDHVTKANVRNKDADHAAGSLRKRAAIDGAAYGIVVITPSSRHQDGESHIIPRKDRSGWRSRGSIAAVVKMLNGLNGTVAITVTQPTDATRKTLGPTRCMAKVSEYLGLQQTAQSKSEIARNVNFSPNVVSGAIDRLVNEGFCTQTDGPRKAKMIQFVKAYVAEASDGGNPF